MNTEPSTPPRSQPDWAMVALFALLTIGAVYALYYAFSMQAILNRQLAGQNTALTKRLATLEAVQSTSVRTDMLDGLTGALEQSKATIATLEARLATLEKTTTAPAPTISFTTTATETETLQQFVALKLAILNGEPFARELLTAATTPEVATVETQLAPFAAEGVASDRLLHDELDGWLEDHPATVIVEDPKLESFNAKLKGLLTIRRKQSAPVDDYAALRAQVEADASLDVLITSVQGLPEESRAPLEAWLKKAMDRQTALQAVHAAELALIESSR